jgi:hypothetical protein
MSGTPKRKKRAVTRTITLGNDQPKATARDPLGNVFL